jgi:hypothetical protein
MNNASSVPGVISAATVTAAAPPASLFSRPRFIHRQRPALPILAIQGRDGSFGPFLRIHRGKGEPARPAGVPIHHDIDLIDRPVRCEQVAQVSFSSVKGQVPDIQFRTHNNCCAGILLIKSSQPESAGLS